MYFSFTVYNTSIPGGPGLFLRANFLGGSRFFLSDGTDFIYRASTCTCRCEILGDHLKPKYLLNICMYVYCALIADSSRVLELPNA